MIFLQKELLHPSWLGVQDTLRIYVFERGGVAEIRRRLETQGNKINDLANGLGIVVETKLPTVVKTKDSRLERGVTPGFIFFLNQRRLQTPLDVLTLTDEIAKQHSETVQKFTLKSSC